MATKKLVDNIGSVDDFGVTGGYDPSTIRKEPTKSRPPNEGEAYVIKWEMEESKDDPKPFVIETRETTKGVIKTIYPLLPFCRGCSPAARREGDSEWSSGWNEEGAEVRMPKGDARLVGVPPEEHYSFTLVERNGEVICNVCEQSPDAEKELDIPILTIQKPLKRTPVTFNAESSQLGIRVEASIIRIPEYLVAKWVAKGQLKSGDLVVGDMEKLYSIPTSQLLRKSIWDETNKEWILSLSKCRQSPALVASIEDDRLTIPQETLIEWRKTALSVSHIVAAHNNGLTHTTSLHEFLVGGYSEGSKWYFDIDNCSGPYFMELEWLTSKDADKKETSDLPSTKQTDILDY